MLVSSPRRARTRGPLMFAGGKGQGLRVECGRVSAFV